MNVLIRWILVIGLLFGSPVASPAQESSISQTVSMDFHDVDIDSVLHFLGEAAGLTIIKDPQLQGPISLTTFGETSVDQALKILTSVLSLKGFTLIRTGDVLKIVPLNTVSQTNVDVIKDYELNATTAKDDTVVTKMITLQYAKAQEVVAALLPLVGHFGSAIPYPRTNTVIITDSSANIARLTDLIDDLDRQVTSLVTRSYQITHANLDSLQSLLKQITEQYEHELGHFEVNSDQRTRTLFVTTLPDNFDMVEKLIHQLDQGTPQVLLEIEVIRVPYRNIDVDIRHRLFDAEKRDQNTKRINDGDRLFNWRYSFDADADKMFSWYGLSDSKTKEDYIYKLNVLYGPDYFDVHALPMLTVAEATEARVTMGHEDYFYRLAPFEMDFKIVPHLNDDDTVSLEMYQHVSGDWLKRQDAYARLVVGNDQTVVLGGLNELRGDPSKVMESVYREDTEYVSNEFLVLLTPHIIWDPVTFKKRVDQQVKDAKQREEKPDLDLLFPGGFMEYDLPKAPPIDETQAENARSLAQDVQPVQVNDGTYGPPTADNAYQMWWTMKDFVQMPDAVVEVKNHMSDTHFVDTEVRDRLRDDAKDFMKQVRQEEELGQEPPVVMEPEAAPTTDKEGYVLKETLYRRGVQFYKKGQYKGAIREFAPIMSIDPQYKNVQRYMELSQQKYKEQLSDLGERNRVTEAVKEKALEDLTQTPMTMDQKMQQLSQKESMGDYTTSDTFFDYIGEPKDIPEDRIEQVATDRLSGEILEVSEDHPLVVLNLGSIQNVHPGMPFKVYRDQEFIGKVRITDVGEHVSGAEVISQKTPDLKFRFGDSVVQALS